MEAIIGVFILYIFWKILVFIWHKIFVPGTKIIWKLITAAATIFFFVFLFFFKELFFDTLPPATKYSILLILGVLAGIKYLRNKSS